MINNLKNKLEKVSISSSALLGLMFLSLACTETRVIEKPGETVYVEVPGETQTETVYVYVDQGIDTIDQTSDQFAQDMDIVLNPGADITPQIDAEMSDMDVVDDLDQEVPEVDQDLPEIEDMDPVDEMDGQVLEQDAGVIFDPSESFENLELHPCSVDNTRLQPNQLVRSYEHFYDPRIVVDYDEPPSNDIFVPSRYTRKFWNVSTDDFSQYQEIACFEYRNTGEEIIVLDRLSYELDGGDYQTSFKFEFTGLNLPEIETEGFRTQVTIAPEGNIPILAGENIQVKVTALLRGYNNIFDYILINSMDPFLGGANSYIFNYIEKIYTYANHGNVITSFYLDNNEFEPEEQDPNQEIVNQINIFSASFSTFLHTFLEQTIDSEVVCNSTGGNYEVKIEVYNSATEYSDNVQISSFQIQNGENRIPFQIQPMLVDSYTELSVRINGENIVQSPQNGDTIHCHLESSVFPEVVEFNQGDNWIDERLYGKHITWVENQEPFIPEDFIWVSFDGYTGQNIGRVEVFENNPDYDDYLVRMELQGYGNYQNIDFNLELTNNDGIFARAKVFTIDRQELFSEDIIIPRGQSQHSFNLNIGNHNYQDNRLFFEILAIDDEQLTLPSSLYQFPPQIKFDLINLEVLDDQQQPINTNADHWSGPRPIPLEENAVRYHYNTPDMYVSYTSQRDQIIDISPNGTLREFERVELGSFEMRNNSSVGKCFTKLVFGKRDKEIELFNQIWINDVLVIAENINSNNFFVDLSNQERCNLNSWGGFNDFYRPSSGFWMDVEFAGTFNPQTVETSDTIQISLLYVEGYFRRYTQEGELRIPFQTFFRDENENWSPLQFNIFNADGSINPELVNQNLEAAPKGDRVTFIRHQ